MQIVIQTDRIDMENHFSKVGSIKYEDETLNDMTNDYIEFVKTIVKRKESISRKFYIVISSRKKSAEDKIITDLLNIGNNVVKCKEAETNEVLKRSFRRTTGIRKETKWV